MTTIKRPVLRYHGGKFILSRRIIDHFPPHRTYVELFGGAGSVLMRKPRSHAEVYNDLWDTVVNVFRILRDPQQAARLEEVIRLTPFSRREFDICGEAQLSEVSDPIEKARLTIFRSFAGFGSASTNAKYSTGFRANSNRSGGPPAMDWKNYPDHIKSFTERLQGVIIENRDYTDILSQHDSPQTLFYADPPYVHSTRNMKRGNSKYVFEFSDQDHITLSEHLHRVTGKVVISGYNSDLYDELYKDWPKIMIDTYADGASPRKEVLWFSPNCLIDKSPLFTPDHSHSHP